MSQQLKQQQLRTERMVIIRALLAAHDDDDDHLQHPTTGSFVRAVCLPCCRVEGAPIFISL